ncbi:MAG: hypothetical protein Q4C72_05610 [Eubacteriales bacterium]|nr:hypothetical protein [Eubacteriales bacterium]
MDGKIKASFDNVLAGDELKEKTLAFVKEQTSGFVKKKRVSYRYAIAAVCVFLLFIGGNWFYFSPTAQISIDINPSVELGINRFDKIISVVGYNEDGRTLAEALDIRFQNYDDAVIKLLAEERIVTLLSNDAVLTVTVVGRNEAQADRILLDLKACTMGYQNTYCYRADSETMSRAHETGLSYGKYRAFLELSSLDPNITPEQIQGMTMREIRDLLQDLSKDDELSPNEDNGQGNHGQGKGRGNGDGGRWNRGK